MAKILVADDEELIRKLVCDFLKKANHTVVEAKDGDEALYYFNEMQDISLMILDIMMPGKDGWEVCREVRKTSTVPILLLSARSQEFDQLSGFEAGADDYVTKPFSPALLMKRVESLLKRSAIQTEVPKESYQGLSIDYKAHLVHIDDETIYLTVKEFKLLEKLLDHVGRVYSREQLIDDVWGFDYYGDTRTVDSHVARLRTKLGDWGNKYLKTVYGIGYKIQETNENKKEEPTDKHSS